MGKLVCLVLMLSIFHAVHVDGARMLKKEEGQVKHPQNFNGGIGVGGYLPTPTGSPPTGFVAGVGLNTSGLTFCTYPGVGCVSVQPYIPGVGSIGSPP